MTNKQLARIVLGYLPEGYVCCSQTCTYVERIPGPRLVGVINANGKPLASVLLTPNTLMLTNIAGTFLPRSPIGI
jgi:hypothetical protein